METGQKRPLINELTQGRELANQLKNHIETNMSPEACDFLLEKILFSYEKVLSMLNWRSDFDETPTSFGEISPGTEVSDPSDSPDQCNKKRRKTMAKWSEQVKVCSGTMVEGPLSDGYSWRKYGQKVILGANHPRAYYRCTHRNVQGCLATKQVQKSDEDSSVFEVTYRGRHTCIQATQLSKALEKKTKKEEDMIQDTKPTQNVHLNHVSSFKFDGVNTGDEEQEQEQNQNQEHEHEHELFPLFSFPSTPFESEKLENVLCLGCDSTGFITFGHNLQSSDSDLSEMINSTPNSATNSPLANWDFSLDHVDFNGNFGFDITNEMFC